MTSCLVDGEDSQTIAIRAIRRDQYASWLAAQPAATADWIRVNGFSPQEGEFLLLPPSLSGKGGAIFIIDDQDPWCWARLASGLPKGRYKFEGDLGQAQSDRAALTWALALYRFERYKRPDPKNPKEKGPELVWPARADRERVSSAIRAIFMVRDLINCPASDMGPEELASAAQSLADEKGAMIRIIAGEQLLGENYPLIHAVGRASSRPPMLIDIRWGDEKHPKVTLAGKGVCFDSGGLDLKSAANMKLMKKDMGGAAHVLGLAAMIIDARLPVRLRVLIPAVDNAVSGSSFRPMDILQSRKGMSVEIGNTDAEGRLVLADCLTEAVREKPDLLIDIATLTGAARVALGPDLPALFVPNDALASDLMIAASQGNDPLWRLPLWKPYRRMLDSKIADINNSSENGFAGAIVAALFLSEFADAAANWIHLDILGWNHASRPGRPEGGEAMGLLALFHMLARKYPL